MRLYTGDAALAERVAAAKLTPLTLCQPLPLVDGDAAELLRVFKPALCAVAGVPCLPHCAPTVAAPAPTPAAGLRPASYLRGKRLRVSRDAKRPHFRRLGEDTVACNGCGAAQRVRTDADLVALAFGPAWNELHWKTFLCRACCDRARVAVAAGAAACHSCYGRHDAALTQVPLRYACADDAARPRQLRLCSVCAAEPHVRAQLTTVRLDGI